MKLSPLALATALTLGNTVTTQAQQQLGAVAAQYKKLSQLRGVNPSSNSPLPKDVPDDNIDPKLLALAWQATAEKKATKVQSFVMDGVELNLSSDEVAGDFCDAASPLSLAGYMNGEFFSIHLLFCRDDIVICTELIPSMN